MEDDRHLPANLVLVSEAPGKHLKFDPNYRALYCYPKGCAGARLREMMGLSSGEYLALRRINVLDHYLGTVSPGSRFPMAEARRAAEAKRHKLFGSNALFVGWRAATAFGLQGDVLKWHLGEAFTWAVVPHTSGVNRWWNDPANRAAGEAFLARVAEQVRTGAQSFR